MHRTNLSRRKFCILSGSTVASLTLASACSRIGGSVIVSDGRLSARPRSNVKTSATGEIKLGLDGKRDAILQIPKNAGQSPLPLFVMLHGATQSADEMFWYLGSAHEEAGVAVLAPNSRDTTWDAIGGNGYGIDVGLLAKDCHSSSHKKAHKAQNDLKKLFAGDLQFCQPHSAATRVESY